MKKIIILLALSLGLITLSYAQMNGGTAGVLDDYQYKYISTASTTTVKTGPGVLQGLLVTGGTAGTIIVYDNIAGSGPVVSSFDSTNAIANYPLNIVFSSGCTVVTGSNTKVTVSYL